MEQVTALWFSAARQTRDALEAIPARVLDQIYAQFGLTDRSQQAEVRLILEEEINTALENLSRSLMGEGAA